MFFPTELVPDEVLYSLIEKERLSGKNHGIKYL
jgi:hypothetical protein